MIDYQAEAIKLQSAVFAAAASGNIAVLNEAFIATNLMGLDNRDEFFSTLAYKALAIASENNQTDAADFLKSEIQSQKLQPLLKKAEPVIYAMTYGGQGISAEEGVAALKISKDEAELVTELVTGTVEIMKDFNKHIRKFTEASSVQLDKDIALSSLEEALNGNRKFGPNKKQKAILQQYGFKPTGRIANVLSRGFNKRANAQLLPQIKKLEKEKSAKIRADYSIATQEYFKDLNAVYARVKSKLSI